MDILRDVQFHLYQLMEFMLTVKSAASGSHLMENKRQSSSAVLQKIKTFLVYQLWIRLFFQNWISTFDTKELGNMTGKVSSENVSPMKIIGDDLNYHLVYIYSSEYAHRLINVGNRYYQYDANGIPVTS